MNAMKTDDEATGRADRAAATLGDPRWAAVVARDADADGQFFYSVSTTGIYCRPSCAARTARPEHVRFHASAADAESAGFRACKRCRPDQPPLAARQAAMVSELCRFMAQADQPPSLEALARRSGYSPYHLHRIFKAITGLTPRAYAEAQRATRARSKLTQGRSITTAIYDAGFNSAGRFYAQSHRILGMTPGRYRAGGEDAEIRFAIGQCALGAILVAASAQGVCAIFMGEEPEALIRDLQDRFPRAALVGDDPEFARLVATVVGFVETPKQGLALPLDIRGTAFQQRVWQALRKIPAGQTASYAEIARRIGAPGSARAVARACAANILAVAIPCHRVVRTDGSPSGYRWGIERKSELLKRESES